MNYIKKDLTKELNGNLEKLLRLESGSINLDFSSNRSLLLECFRLIGALANLPEKEIVSCPSCGGSGLRPGMLMSDHAIRAAMTCYDCIGKGKMCLSDRKCPNVCCDDDCPFCKGFKFMLERVSDK